MPPRQRDAADDDMPCSLLIDAARRRDAFR